MRVALGIEYDGTAYNGWQRQKTGIGIQALVEEALSSVADEAVEVVCAGRTDAGVHASAQVVHFDSNAERSSRGWLLGANTGLPDDINANWAVFADDEFHARYSATSRTYRYVILNRLVRSALYRKRAWWVYEPLEEQAMRDAGEYLLGEHDLSAFRAAGCQASTPVRRIHSLQVHRSGDWLTVTITANAFLQHMVRNITGLLVRIGKGDEEAAWARTVLESRDRTQGGVAAPPHGLTLVGVEYPPQFQIPTGTDPGTDPGSGPPPNRLSCGPMSWFEKLMPSRISTEQRTRSVPEGVWIKCPECDAQLYRTELDRSLQVCPKCDYHIRIGARTRLDFFLDPEDREEIAADLEPQDPLRFRDSKKYRDRISQAQKKTGEKDAMIAVRGRLFGRPIVACAFEFAFMGGSMGSVVGERFCRAANYCAENRVPLIAFSASGGARMQEALFSLLQMAKTSAALAVLGELKIPFISVLTDPTTGGVSASLAMLGDVNIAEPKALIGFAGPRVIEQTVRQKLPDGFQRSEFLLDHGAIDMIVDRRKLREEVADLLAKFENRANPAAQSG